MKNLTLFRISSWLYVKDLEIDDYGVALHIIMYNDSDDQFDLDYLDTFVEFDKNAAKIMEQQFHKKGPGQERLLFFELLQTRIFR